MKQVCNKILLFSYSKTNQQQHKALFNYLYSYENVVIFFSFLQKSKPYGIDCNTANADVFAVKSLHK